ncbi:MAG TPA: DUF1761 domain-containing protein, partial [Aliiroseovarius sp.]|nr:DUF1761 domain-containing protein [Aliiroseovarius sp.]
MEIINVIAAAAAAWIFGAIWYGVMGKRWMAAAGLTEETINRKNTAAFIGSFLCAILVAGMIRHVFAASNVTEMGGALVSGLGLGLFVASPWLVTNYLFAQRPVALMVIDAVYAT